MISVYLENIFLSNSSQKLVTEIERKFVFSLHACVLSVLLLLLELLLKWKNENSINTNF